MRHRCPPQTTFDFRAHSTDYAMRCGLTRFTDRDYKPLPPQEETISYININVMHDHVDAIVPPELAEKYRKMASEMLDKHITWHAGVTVMGDGSINRWSRK